MLLAQSWTALTTISLGVFLLFVGFLLRRSSRRVNQSRRQDPLGEVRRNMRTAEQSEAAALRKLEVRLHDYRREVEGQVQTRIALLNQPIADADTKIAQLRELQDQAEQLLEEPHTLELHSPADDSSISTEQRRTVLKLFQKGLTHPEIADCLDCPSEEIRAILDEPAGDHRADAA